MVGRRLEIWWIDFGDPIGSEPAYRRPAIVVSSNRFNDSRINTVIVCAITSNLRLAKAPGNMEITAGEAELPKDCVINVSQILVVDRQRLESKIGQLPTWRSAQLEAGLKLVLGL